MSVSLSGRKLIASSLRLIGVLAQGETANANDESAAFDVLNQLIDSWETHALTKLARVRHVDDLEADQASYTIGPSGDLDHPRPTEIDAAAWFDPTTNQEYPLSPLTTEAYDLITNKEESGTQPTSFYYEPTDPDGTIYLWPVPDNSTYDLVLYVKSALTQYANRDTAVDLPPGYAKALRYNLAVELAPEFGRPLDPLILKIASDTLSALKQQNVRMADLSLDPMFTGGSGAYDITTDS